MTDAKGRTRPSPPKPDDPTRCDRLHRALSDCHRRIPAGRARQSACRHLNRSLAECLVSVVCPDEAEAVRTLCSSSGTELKRSQCQGAQLSLAVCLSAHQIGE
uniref:COX assembly mitochondrial protein n=1 Tax=Kalanchoe fedtschenkoi TaxID=63787 RepID=A0A7N0RFS6_KALFE